MAQPEADVVRKLLQELAAAEQRAKEAEQRAGEAEQRAGEAEQLLEQERAQTEETSFPSFLKICHNSLSKPLRVQTDQSLTTQGSITSPKGKIHPAFLQPWLDFPDQQQRCFDAAYDLLCPGQSPPPKYFPPRIVLENLGRSLCQKPLASEKDLEKYEWLAVEERVRDIIRRLLSLPDAQALVDNCDDIEFENHLNSLSEDTEEVTTRQKRSSVDQACIFRYTTGQRSLLLIREYKAAHKLTLEYLRAGLRPMNVREEVVQRQTIPQDYGDKLNYNADRLVASAITQTFEYMIDNGLEFGSIATGLAEVFLRIPEDEPETVYYYLAEPNLDVTSDEALGFQYPFTAVSRMFSFTLMALSSEARSQAWRHLARERLQHWYEEFDDILYDIPSTERQATPPASVYKPPSYPMHPRSPYLLRRRLLAPMSVDLTQTRSFESDSSFSDDPTNEATGEATLHDTPSRSQGGTKRKRTDTKSSSHQQREQQGSSSPGYCTMRCLLGLKTGGALDTACPNYLKHRQASDVEMHLITLESFLQQVRAQLAVDTDHFCHPLGKQGSRGALFKITLVSHGYTFVAKGTVQTFVTDIHNEGRVYNHLASEQGDLVPVFLGNIDLDRVYFYDIGVNIVHMLLMSWGGHSLSDQTSGITHSPPDIQFEMQRLSDRLWQLGVDHRDIRPQNFLWTVEGGRWLVIDFERSRLHAKRSPKSRMLASDTRRSKKRMAGVGKRISSLVQRIAVKS